MRINRIKRITQFMYFAILLAGAAIAQNTPGTTQGNQAAGPVVSGTLITYSPVQLGVSALTEPASGTTALSNIVNTSAVRELTLFYNCTNGNITVNVQTYAEDGSTQLALISPVSATPAAAWSTLHIGSEANPTANVGTVSATAILRLPMRALAFSFTNAGTAGTCTARLLAEY